MTDPALTARVIQSVRVAAKIPAMVAIQTDSRLIEDLNIDSLDLVGVYLKIQDDFGVIIDDADVPGLARISDLASYIDRNPSASAA